MVRGIYYYPGEGEWQPAPAPDMTMYPRLRTIEERLAAIEAQLKQLAVVKQAETPALRVGKWAKLIGVSDTYLKRFVQNGQLRAVKMGENVLLVLRDDLIDFLRGLPPVETSAGKD
jgi:excisionase family DNA binding protein